MNAALEALANRCADAMMGGAGGEGKRSSSLVAGRCRQQKDYCLFVQLQGSSAVDLPVMVHHHAGCTNRTKGFTAARMKVQRDENSSIQQEKILSVTGPDASLQPGFLKNSGSAQPSCCRCWSSRERVTSTSAQRCPPVEVLSSAALPLDGGDVHAPA